MTEYKRIAYDLLRTFCIKVFQGYHFTEEESEAIKQKLIEDAEMLSPEARKIVVDAMMDKQA